MKHSDAVIGNSSSGLIEAPALGIPTVNIGDRQKGRLHGASVIDCPEKTDSIIESIRLALSPQFKEITRHTDTPYGARGASKAIAELLATQRIDGFPAKHFFDLPHTHTGRG